MMNAGKSLQYTCYILLSTKFIKHSPIHQYASDKKEPLATTQRTRPVACTYSDQQPQNSKSNIIDKIAWLSDKATAAFPVLMLLGCILAVTQPTAYAWFTPALMEPSLAGIMLAMGLSLTFEDFAAVLKLPYQLVLGVFLQYTLMPSLGLLASTLLPLAPATKAGIILVSCCPGGVASNLITFLAKGDVALSVLMTASSTILAVVTTPLLTSLLVGTTVPVNGLALFASTLKVVLFPVLIGLVLNEKFPAQVDAVRKTAPLAATILTVLITAASLARNAAFVMQSGAVIFGALCVLHGGGFMAGYFGAKVFGLPERSRRTISVEVGMQNSTLGVLLATRHFPDPLSPVPCALSAVFHSLTGSALAAVWSRNVPKQTSEENQ